jgi:DNA-binding XRE family transcriptional regulator
MVEVIYARINAPHAPQAQREVYMKIRNHVKELREARMLGKTELAKLAGVSPLIIDRIEKGMPCRLGSQRWILLALGLKLTQRRRVFRDS